ncbi:MAG: hypothetical protein ACRDI3_08305 [Actinomycetota bacterium]
MKILLVCTGNLCRSPMAEGILRHRLEERGCDIEVGSVGTWASHGIPATDEAIETLRKRGIDLSSHRSRAVEAEELRSADLIVGMTSVHRREVVAIAPDVEGRFVLLKELVELALDGELPGGAEARLERLLGAPRPEWRRALDLDDPIGKPIGAYEKTAAEIQMAMEVLVDALCDGKPRS